MTPEQAKAAIIGAFLGAVFGGAGIVGLLFAYIRHFIDKRLNERDAEAAKQKSQHLRRITIDDEWKHALGRLLFFVHKAIVTGEHNGDLEASFEKFQETEEKKKALDRELLAEIEMGGPEH